MLWVSLEKTFWGGRLTLPESSSQLIVFAESYPEVSICSLFPANLTDASAGSDPSDSPHNENPLVVFFHLLLGCPPWVDRSG
jgi:hypothetical protein